jgi:hypothetical protein
MILIILIPWAYAWLKTNELRNENSKLREEMTILQNQLAGYSYAPVVQTSNSTIKLGNEYKASIGLSLIDLHNLPKIVVCNYKNNKLYPTKDTLAYNRYEQLFEYKFKPNKTGTYKWGGIISLKINGFNKRLPIVQKYTVTN